MNKQILSFLLISTMITTTFIATTSTKIYATEQTESVDLETLSKSAILIEATTGEVLYQSNPDEKLPPASVTKVMTLLLIYEAIDTGKIKWDDIVTVSEYASSMGGSQIFLEPMEQQTVKDLTKSIAIASANDSAIAMAEFISGSEPEFVKAMNNRAKELGMANTNFENACGLDANTTNHYMSARDIATVSRVLMTNFPQITEFTTTWQDTITHKTKKGETEFGLTNTNKLIKWYDGATGLKTGSTSKALYCLSGSATRDDLSLIAVVMGAQDPKVRFQEVMKMFDYGFSNYQTVTFDSLDAPVQMPIYKGKLGFVDGNIVEPFTFVAKKGNAPDIIVQTELIDGVVAPISKGAKLGEAIYSLDNTEIGRVDIIALKDVDKANLIDIFKSLIIDWVS